LISTYFRTLLMLSQPIGLVFFIMAHSIIERETVGP
jgi:hypothetical protein